MKKMMFLFIVMLSPFFQNCSAPQADSVPTAVIIGPGSSSLPSTGLPAGYPTTGVPSTTVPSSTLPSSGLPSSGTPSKVALVATYAPNPATTSKPAVISVANGTAPYRYTLLSGAGVLTNNTYAAPATPEVAVIGIVDSLGASTSITMVVQPDPAAIANPFAGKTPAQISDRACDLQAVQYAVNIATGINYEYCLVIARYSNNAEGTKWYHDIKSQSVKPEALITALYHSGVLESKYHIDQMTMQAYIIFMSNHLLFRMPTEAEGAQMMAVGQTSGKEGIYNAIMSSDAFYAANPFMYQIKNMY